MVGTNAVNTIELATCRGCGKTFGVDCERSNVNREYCKSCGSSASKEAQELKKSNDGWLERAVEEGIPLWEQQPGESNEEYNLWRSYMELWPGVRPTVSKTATATGVAVSTVQRAYNRWTWGARLQAWIRECTAERTAELRAARRKMVDDHVTMGELMRAKAMDAIAAFDPYDVTPNELVSILKETQRLESTARDMLDDVERAVASDIDSFSPVDAPAGLFVDSGTAELPAGASPNRGLDAAGMLEVAEILANAGVLKVSKTVEVRRADEPIEAVGYEL